MSDSSSPICGNNFEFIFTNDNLSFSSEDPYELRVVENPEDESKEKETELREANVISSDEALLLFVRLFRLSVPSFILECKSRDNGILGAEFAS